jgi:membrane protease subunit HflC
MKRSRIILIVVAVLLLFTGFNSVYTVSETQQALVLQFGEVTQQVREPGLKFKIPFIQDVRIIDKRILDLDVPAEEVIASDQKRLVVDAFARFKIIDPLRFYVTVNNEETARARLRSLVNASLRRVLGSVEFSAVLSEQRADLMLQIRDAVNSEGQTFGINVVDVRIRRADLPQENSQAIYKRMQTEREQEAREFRARGAEEGQRIRANAERQRTVLLSEARKQSEILRGEGDAQATKIYADAYDKDPEFFEFYRSMEAYKNALGKGDTRLILSPDSDFLKFFEPHATESTTRR